jgi:aspartyl-tRNA(Asn)/glutamyl-tRNA(Gln) amidotransferase subunit C
MIDDKTLKSILSLCKFILNAGEKERFKEQVGQILSYIETLNKVNTQGVDPDLGKALEASDFREDKPGRGLQAGEVAALSRHFQDSFFTVPRILEEMDERQGDG